MPPSPEGRSTRSLRGRDVLRTVWILPSSPPRVDGSRVPQILAHRFLDRAFLSPPCLPGHPAYQSTPRVDDRVVLYKARVWVRVIRGKLDHFQAEITESPTVDGMLFSRAGRTERVLLWVAGDAVGVAPPRFHYDGPSWRTNGETGFLMHYVKRGYAFGAKILLST